MAARVIAFKAPKEAALYFDEVLPFDFGANMIAHAAACDPDDLFGFERLEVPLHDYELSDKVLKSLGGENAAVEPIYRESLLRYAWIIFATIYSNDKNKKYRSFVASDEKYAPIRRMIEASGADHHEVLKKITNGTFNHRRYTKRADNEIVELIGRAGFSQVPTWCGDSVPVQKGSKANDFALTLSGMKLVDAEKISWAHLIEMRKDKDSMRRLRDFRILFHEEFQGQSIAYVEDRIMAGLENHQRVAKEWSFELFERSLSVVGSKENVGSTTLVGGMLALTGAPTSVIAASGLAVSLVSASVEVAKVFRDRAKGLNSGYAYLSSLKEIEAS